MHQNNRRDFIRKGIIGISGAALAPQVLKASPAEISRFTEPVKLPSRKLGRSGIETPLISMGAGGATNPGFVRTAYEAGVRMFFSANYYGEGNNEILVGEGLKDVPRETFVLGTASWPDELDRRTGKLTAKLSTDAFIKKAEGSLKRFGMDHIDILLLPYASDKELVANEEVMTAMSRLKKDGKVSYIGIASHSGTVAALDAAAEAGIYDVAMITYNFKMPDREAVDASVSKAAKAGMGIIAMKTTAGVFRSKNGPEYNSDAILKWVLQNKEISTIVSAMSSAEQLNRNLSMIQNIEMTEKEKADLKLMAFNDSYGLWCRQCRECVPQCAQSLEIPTAMRSYMYAYGYRNTAQAWHTLAEAEIPEEACSNCSECAVKCSAGFDVKTKLEDILRLRKVPSDFLVG